MTRPLWGMRPDDRYRTISRDRLIDMLLVAGFPLEVQAGKRADAVTSIEASLARWIDLGLGFRVAENGDWLFDPVEVVNCMKWSGLQGLDDFWAGHFVESGRGVLREWNEAEEAGSAEMMQPRQFDVSLIRKFDLSNLSPSSKARLRIPLPLSGWTHVGKIVPLISEELAANVTISEGRMEVQVAAPANRTIEIGARISFTTTGFPCDRQRDGLNPKDLDLYLRPHEGLIKITPRIAELAGRVAGTSPDKSRIVAALWAYMLDELNCGMVHYDQVSVEAPGETVIDTGWYDCQLGASLFISMCRSQGIPARIVSGHVLYSSAPGYHYWAEVWLDGKGWTPFDVLCWDLSKAGHDKNWRDHFAGRVDYRMVTQCMPLSFTGPMTVRFPNSWHLTTAPIPTGMATTFHDLNDGLIYSDLVTISKAPATLAASSLS